jgi:molecular chaperone GrpE (heat shock protein)
MAKSEDPFKFWKDWAKELDQECRAWSERELKATYSQSGKNDEDGRLKYTVDVYRPYETWIDRMQKEKHKDYVESLQNENEELRDEIEELKAINYNLRARMEQAQQEQAPKPNDAPLDDFINNMESKSSGYIALTTRADLALLEVCKRLKRS